MSILERLTGHEGHEGHEGRAANDWSFTPMNESLFDWDAGQIIADTAFPLGAWDPALRAQVLTAEFGVSGWRTSVKLGSWTTIQPDTNKELMELQLHIGVKRLDRLTEILAQDKHASRYFCNMFMLGEGARPNTYILLLTAFAVGSMVALHFKYLHQRPRPVQLYPGLVPPLPTPGHSAYPSGHGLQSYLAAKCLALVHPPLGAAAEKLAGRIAENREIAGLHYPSDQIASQQLVGQIMPLLTPGAMMQQLLEAAKAEWPQSAR